MYTTPEVDEPLAEREPSSLIVRRVRLRLSRRDRFRFALTSTFVASFAFASVFTYHKGLQALDEILSGRRKPVLTPVAAAPPPGRDVRQIPLNADLTPVATIAPPAMEPPPPFGAHAFPPVERAGNADGFRVTSGR